jgi:hypothetical protein
MVAFASAYVFFATQMYTTDTLVRADPPDLNELGVSPLDRQSLPPTPSLSNEIAVMQSHSVVEPVIQRRGLVEITYSDELREWAVEVANAQRRRASATAGAHIVDNMMRPLHRREPSGLLALSASVDDIARAEPPRDAHGTDAGGGQELSVDQSCCAARRNWRARTPDRCRHVTRAARGFFSLINQGPLNEELKGEIHPLGRDPQGRRRPLLVHICFIQSVPLPLLAPLELGGSLYFEPACSSSRERLLWHAWSFGEV